MRFVELGAGSADKTRCCLMRQLIGRTLSSTNRWMYRPAPWSKRRFALKNEIPGVLVCPRVQDYTQDLELDATLPSERRLVLYIGSSIGNFEPGESLMLLERVRAALEPGDCLLLGVDLVKDEADAASRL